MLWIGTNNEIHDNTGHPDTNGGGGADLSVTVILAPTTDGRNVIQPSAPDVKPLTVRGAAGQTEHLLMVEDSTGVPYLWTDAQAVTHVRSEIGVREGQTGEMWMGPEGPGGKPGLVFGNDPWDTNLYKNAASILRTDGTFQAMGRLNGSFKTDHFVLLVDDHAYVNSAQLVFLGTGTGIKFSDGTVQTTRGGWVQMTQAAYDALPVKDPNLLYVIIG